MANRALIINELGESAVAAKDTVDACKGYLNNPAPSQAEEVSRLASLLSAGVYAFQEMANRYFGPSSNQTGTLKCLGVPVGALGTVAGLLTFSETLDRYQASPAPGNLNDLVKGVGDLLAGLGNAAMAVGSAGGDPATLQAGVILVGYGSVIKSANDWSENNLIIWGKFFDALDIAKNSLPSNPTPPCDPMPPLQQRFEQDMRMRRVDPLVLDLDGDGVETLAVTAGAYFDHAGDGFAESTGWAGPDDGLLVLDRNGNGIIDNGGELFGDNTLLATGRKAPNGFEALKELDANHDGRIDANDPAYALLRVWKDADGDGFSLPEELLTLAEAGVKKTWSVPDFPDFGLSPDLVRCIPGDMLVQLTT